MSQPIASPETYPSDDGVTDALAMLEATAQMLWVGSSAGFALVGAPVAYRAVPDLATFATITERNLTRLGRFSLLGGGVAIAAALGRASRPGGGTGDRARAALTVLALSGAVYQGHVIMPAMRALRAEMGRMEDVDPEDPRRVAYRAWHARSTRVYGAALLLGTVALAATTKRAPAPSSGVRAAPSLDHLVLTVADVETTSRWYARVLGMEPIVFGDDRRRGLRFGDAKINLHPATTVHTNGSSGSEARANVARRPTPGSADLCFRTKVPLVDVLAHLHAERVPIERGPVARSGARRPLSSVYVRDPDGNLVEISNER